MNQVNVAVGARRVFHNLVVELFFTFFRLLTEEGPRKKKYPVSSESVEENVLLMSRVKGQRP